MPRPAVTATSVGDIKALQRDFERSQRAARRSLRTIGTYREGIDQLAAFLDGAGMPTKVAGPGRERRRSRAPHRLERERHAGPLRGALPA